MTFYQQPEKELTPEEKLLAEVIMLSHRIPCGGQICLHLNLDTAIDKVDKFFTEYQLPLKYELLGELRLWKDHAEQGRKFSDQCDLLMQKVIRLVDGANKNSTRR